MEWNWFTLGGTGAVLGQYGAWLIHDGTGSVWCGAGWYLVVLGQYNLVLLGMKWYWVDMGL